ncbi:MAG: hypothetical protein JWL69_3117 [Phycisphaerales bacterium]|nr:hypothetical protein [Phycisphaerales bacterium]
MSEWKQWVFICRVGQKAKAVRIFAHDHAPVTEAEAVTACNNWEAAGGTDTAALTAEGVTLEVIPEEIGRMHKIW